MTAVFGLSVAIWCGEFSFKEKHAQQLESGRAIATIGPNRSSINHPQARFAASSARFPLVGPRDASKLVKPAAHRAKVVGPSFDPTAVPPSESPALKASLPNHPVPAALSPAATLAGSSIFARARELAHVNQLAREVLGSIQECARFGADLCGFVFNTFFDGRNHAAGAHDEANAKLRISTVREAETAPNLNLPAANTKVAPPKVAESTTQPFEVSCRSLIDQLQSMETSLPSGGRTALRECSQILAQIATHTDIADPRLGELLDRATAAHDQLVASFTSFANEPTESVAGDAKFQRLAAQFDVIRYEVCRSITLWSAVHRLAIARGNDISSASPMRLSNDVRWDFSRVDPAWREYLKLELLEHPQGERTEAARAVLSRIHSVALNDEQRAQVSQIIGPEAESAMRAWAARPLDPAKLLVDYTSFQRRQNGLTESRLNDDFQNILWAGQRELGPIVQVLDDHFRNANVRLSISEHFINRLLAKPLTQDEPVRDQILGADVEGRSRVTNQLGVQLVPDSDRWSLMLTTSGNILSRTQAHRDGFVVHSIGTAEIFGSKKVSISLNGVQSQQPTVEAVTDNQVVGLDSPFDSVPLLGWTARRVALRKQQSMAPLAEQQVRSRIRTRIEERMEQAVAAALQKARDELNQQLIGRFVQLRLEPQPVEMRTSEDELVLRYRLAGFDQMAADTPRPAIDVPMAASLQVHDSAINNGLARLELAARSFTVSDLMRHLESKLNTTLGPAHPKIQNAKLEFAAFDPVRIGFEQDQVKLQLNFKKLQVDNAKQWNNVTVQTQYAVEFDGFYLTLKQVGGVRGEGKSVRARDEMAIGAIFDHALKDEYRFSLLPESYQADFANLGVQLAYAGLENGWLTVAYHDLPPRPDVPRQAGRIFPRNR
jgi:hypothetical protein